MFSFLERKDNVSNGNVMRLDKKVIHYFFVSYSVERLRNIWNQSTLFSGGFSLEVLKVSNITTVIDSPFHRRILRLVLR